MRRKDRKKKKFRAVFNLKYSQRSFMKDREVNLEETQSQVHDQNQSQHICTEPWLKTSQV